MGQAADVPVLRTGGKTAVCYLRLIQNEYAGQDEGGERRERQTAISFTAFDKLAETIAKHVGVGDQITVEYRLAADTVKDDETGEITRRQSQIIQNFHFGKEGKAKRTARSRSNSDGNG